MNQLETESLYLQYFAMGESRTLADLAQNTGKSKDTLYKLSAKQKWTDRIKLDTEALKRDLGYSDIENLGASDRLSAISQESLHKVHKAIRDVPVNTVKDAQLMLTISQLTAQRPTEITYTQDTRDNLVDVSALFNTMYRVLPKEWADKLFNAIGEGAAAQAFGDDSQPATYN